MKSIFCHKAKAVPPAANTLRFEFGDQSYSPVTAGVGGSGTWKKCDWFPSNVWDWTNTNTSWATAFGGGSTTNPGAFADYENNPVKVIAAGDTSSVTDFSRFFQNCYAITEICPIDTSNATTVFLMFSHLHNCEKFPDMDFSSAVASNGTTAVYQACYEMVSAPNIIFPTNHTYSLQNFFVNCVKLENVPLYDTSYCNNMQNMFCFDNNAPGKSRLTHVPLFNTSKVTTMKSMFQRCESLIDVPEFDTSNVTNMSTMFTGGALGTLPAVDMKLESIPNFDYSKVTGFAGFMNHCINLSEIPEMNIEANVTSCNKMFIDCPNVKSGQKALYDKLSAIATITNHTDCFKDCGSDTEEGRAELAQISVSWGGTKEEV
jgi:surface protein